MVGDTGVGFSVIKGEREGGACIVTKVVGDEVVQHRMARDGVLGGVKVLEKGKAKALTDFIPDGKEEQSATILAKLAHRCGNCSGGREQ